MTSAKRPIPLILLLTWMLAVPSTLIALDLEHLKLLSDARPDRQSAKALEDRRRSWYQRTYEIWHGRLRSADRITTARSTLNALNSFAELLPGGNVPSLLGRVFEEFVNNQISSSYAKSTQDGLQQMVNLIEEMRASSPISAERARYVEEYIRQTLDYSTIVAAHGGDGPLLESHHNRVMFELAYHMLAANFADDAQYRAEQDRRNDGLLFDANQIRTLGERLLARDELLEQTLASALGFQEEYHNFIRRQESIAYIQTRRIEATYEKSIALRDDVASLDAAVVSLDDEVTQITEDLSVLQDDQRFNRLVLFSELSPKKQLEILEHRPGFLSAATADEDSLRDLLQIQVEAQELADDALALEHSTLAVVRALAEIGFMTTELASTVTAATKAATAIANARVALLSDDRNVEAQMADAADAVGRLLLAVGVIDEDESAGFEAAMGMGVLGVGLVSLNPALILSGVSMIFGSGLRSTTDSQHAKMMVRIAQRLEIVEQRLVKIERGIMALADGQTQILRALSDTQETVTDAAAELGRSLEDLHLEEMATRKAILASTEAGAGLSACESFVNGRRELGMGFEEDREPLPNIDVTMGEFGDWDGIADYYNSRQAFFEKCFLSISSIFGALVNREISPWISMATYSNAQGKGNLSDYITRGFRPLSQILATSFPLSEYTESGRVGGLNVFCAFLNSPLAYEEIGWRWSRPGPCQPGSSRGLDPVAALIGVPADAQAETLALSSPISAERLIYYTVLLMEILPYQSLVGGDYGLRDVEDLLDATDRMGIIRKREANQLMWEAYRLVNIAIAQQVLLTGDVGAPSDTQAAVDESGGY